MKVTLNPELGCVTMVFKNREIVDTFFQNGIIVHLDEDHNVVAVDIVNSDRLKTVPGDLSLKEACKYLGIYYNKDKEGEYSVSSFGPLEDKGDMSADKFIKFEAS